MIDSATIQQRGITLEWLEADGLGGFASGTVSGVRTRRYHALLLTATLPPSGRIALVNGLDVWLKQGDNITPLSSQAFAPDYLDLRGEKQMKSFTTEPWPRWIFAAGDEGEIEHELFVPHGSSAVALSWKWNGSPLHDDVTLFVRPFFSGRDFHTLHHENPAYPFQSELIPGGVRWPSYPGLPAIISRTNGTYQADPLWYRHFLYSEEQRRGLDHIEDLTAPGVFSFNLATEKAILIFAAEGFAPQVTTAIESPAALHEQLRTIEANRRAAFPSPLHRAADAYIVKRGSGETIIAGYPWFGDWGRDTFIALRGLCLATGRLAEARSILLEWAGAVSEGMLPNRFPDHGGTPEYNSVDASLWYIIAVHDFINAVRIADSSLLDGAETMQSACEAILSGYTSGTRYGIRRDADGLLACGEPGVQLTWMDAKVGDWVVTPRIGKPVEIQALWLNALWIGSQWNPQWQSHYDSGLASFRARFWNESHQCLDDVVDCDHRPGTSDSSLRPNQIFAVGGLPLNLLPPEHALAVVQTVHNALWTPAGLRSLSPGDPAYAPHYEGDVLRRDGSYHQGTVWPWLAGPFIEAWMRVHENDDRVRAEVHARFFEPLLTRLHEAGLGHLSEIADAETPHLARGCPFQAWSLGELLRVKSSVLG